VPGEKRPGDVQQSAGWACITGEENRSQGSTLAHWQHDLEELALSASLDRTVGPKSFTRSVGFDFGD